MAKTRFPSLIHVTWEEPGGSDDPYLVAHPEGVSGLEESGQAVAIYQLVDDGRVRITREFISQRKSTRRRALRRRPHGT